MTRNERHRDAERHVITAVPMVFEVPFDIRVLWITSTSLEQIVLGNQGFAIYCLLSAFSWHHR